MPDNDTIERFLREMHAAFAQQNQLLEMMANREEKLTTAIGSLRDDVRKVEHRHDMFNERLDRIVRITEPTSGKGLETRLSIIEDNIEHTHRRINDNDKNFESLKTDFKDAKKFGLGIAVTVFGALVSMVAAYFLDASKAIQAMRKP